jgi:hypothetical protein
MSADDRQAAMAKVDELAALLRALPASERTAQALYHAERLKLALAASHQEAVRFAAFTVNKNIADAGAAYGSGVASAMADLRAALEAADHHF